MTTFEFTNQYKNRMICVVIENVEYSLEVVKGDSLEEQKEEFFFEFPKSENSEKAFSLITNAI